MALQGTLKDFGIADILQLIGQQQKTGVLHLRAKEQEVHIAFKDGNIVRAESTTRKKKELLGNMLARAEIITEQQLELALETQKRTLKRLGDVLISSKFISQERFRQMMQLQATETLYKLFSWKTGSYHFEQQEVDTEGDAMTPLRAESVLMEGFRMVDEWPVIRKRITSYEMRFERLKDLPPPALEEDDADDAFDDAFSEEKKAENKGEFKSVGEAERKVYSLVTAARDVRKLIDISCLGEFETCKALCNLVNLEYLKAVPPVGKTHSLEGGSSLLERAGGLAARVAVTLMVLMGVAFIGTRVNAGAIGLARRPTTTFEDPATLRFISSAQISRIEAALDVYRLEKGEVPPQLDALVDAGLLRSEDLRYPWRDAYYYRRVAPLEFVLLPPLR